MAGLTPDFSGAAAAAMADLLPQARRATLDATGHVPDPVALAPILTGFYTD